MHGRDQPPPDVPPQTDTVKWARMLAAARIADQMETGDLRETDADPPTIERLKTLLPIARARYEDEVLPTAKAESERIDNIIAHCREFVKAKEARKSPAFKRGAEEKQWNEQDCQSGIGNLLVPVTFITLRPASRDVIGAQLIPRSPVWQPLRSAIKQGFLKGDDFLSKAFGLRKLKAIDRGIIVNVDLLGSVRFVDLVLDCAPELVRALPAGWTSGKLSNELITALVALLKLPNTRPLSELVEGLSEGEYSFLVEEHSRLSQLLVIGAPSGAYAPLLNMLGPGASLRSVPKRLGRPRLDKAALYSITWEPSGESIQAPPQWDTVTWARMLAAARGADSACPVTVDRLYALLPIARALYVTTVLPIAKKESELIQAVIDHCQEFLQAKESKRQADAESAPEPWKEAKCIEAMEKMRVPASFMTLRPASPEVIGHQLTPLSPVWGHLRQAIAAEFLAAEKLQPRALSARISNAFQSRKLEKKTMQPLDGVKLVDSVLDCAPALVRALPAGWASPELSNELIGAFQALLNVGGTRPLSELVEELSEDEYALLIQEHACLSQLLDRGEWAPSCDNERNIDEYAEFVGFLQQGGSVEDKESAKRPRTKPGSARKRQRVKGEGSVEPTRKSARKPELNDKYSGDQLNPEVRDHDRLMYLAQVANEMDGGPEGWPHDMVNMDVEHLDPAVCDPGDGESYLAQVANEMDDGPEGWPHDMVNMDVEHLDPVICDPGDCESYLAQLTSEMEGYVAEQPQNGAWDLREPGLDNGAAGALMSSDGVTVNARAAVGPLVAAVGLLVLAVVIRLRARRVVVKSCI